MLFKIYPFIYSFSFMIVILMFVSGTFIKNDLINSVFYTSCVVALLTFLFMAILYPNFYCDKFCKLFPYLSKEVFNLLFILFHLLPIIFFKYPLNKTLTFCLVLLYYVFFKDYLKYNYPLKDYELFLASLTSLIII